MRKTLLLIPALLLVTQALCQNKELANKLKGFDQFVDKVMKDWQVQGMAVAIVHKNKIILSKGYGYRNVEQKLPVTDETLFATGSCTKAFTAAGVCPAERNISGKAKIVSTMSISKAPRNF